MIACTVDSMVVHWIRMLGSMCLQFPCSFQDGILADLILLHYEEHAFEPLGCFVKRPVYNHIQRFVVWLQCSCLPNVNTLKVYVQLHLLEASFFSIWAYMFWVSVAIKALLANAKCLLPCSKAVPTPFSDASLCRVRVVRGVENSHLQSRWRHGFFQTP